MNDRNFPRTAYCAEYAPCSQPRYAGKYCVRVTRNDQARTPDPRLVCDYDKIEDALRDIAEPVARVYAMDDCACKFFSHE